MTSHVPRVTIGVPCYNSERYLALGLDSLLAQTYSDIEIIICDNASTDATAQIARDYARRDPRIRYVRNATNIGAGRNFIRCVELARTELFRWQSADDFSAPTFVERCVDVLDAHPDVVQAFPLTTLVDEKGNEISKYDDRIETMSDNPRKRYMHVMWELQLVNAFYGVMRTNALRKTHIHGSYVSADLVVQAEIALYGKIKAVPEYLFFRRMHGQAHSAMTAGEKETFYNPTARLTRANFTLWRVYAKRLASVAHSGALRTLAKSRLMASIVWDAILRRHELWEEVRMSVPATTRRARA